MLSADYSLYYQDTLSLVKSVVIKFEVQNKLLNDFLTAAGLTVSSDAKTWKYNLNLTGEYHSVDLPMTVFSSDTQEEIDFTKAVLKDHPRTVARHRKGQPGYDELTTRFPKQAILIDGITRPLVMADVIKARDFQILNYDKTLVANNEISLINRLQDWIDSFVSRWWNPDYAISDPLYPSAFIGILYMQMIPAIMNIRLGLANTGEASQFHIWSYLGGHYELDQYKSLLSDKQSLWLYRNIVDIRRNAGKAKKLEEMMTNLTKPKGVSISKVDFIQKDDNLLSSLRRAPAFTVSPYYTQKLDYASGNLLDVEDIYDETKLQATYNLEEAPLEIPLVEKKAVASIDNRLPTKILRADEDGSVVASTIANTPLKMNYWLYLSALDKYEVDFTIPIPGGNDVVLDAKNAFILFVYAVNKAGGRETQNIPTCRAGSVIPQTYPTFSELRPLATEQISDDDINNLLDNLEPFGSVNSKEEFTTKVDNILNQHVRHEVEANAKPTPFLRSQMDDLTGSLRTDVNLSLAPSGSTYDNWFLENGIDKFGKTGLDWFELAVDILETVIGYTESGSGLGPSQKAMVDIVDKLTSYDVMFIEGTGQSRGASINVPHLMYFDLKVDYPQDGEITIGLSALDESGAAVEHTVANTIDLSVADVLFTPDPPTEDSIDVGQIMTIVQSAEAWTLVDAPNLFIDIVDIEHTTA